MCVELHNANEASAQSRARRVVFWTRGAGDWNKLRCSAAGVGSVTFGKDLFCDAKARPSSEASADQIGRDERYDPLETHHDDQRHS